MIFLSLLGQVWCLHKKKKDLLPQSVQGTYEHQST